MKTNMGGIDRIVRLIIALIIGYLYYAGQISGTLGIALLVFAAVFILTSLVGFCPLYTLFGFNTCKKKE